MDEEFDKRAAFENRRTDKVIIGKRFMIGDKPTRIISKVVDGGESYRYGKVLDEIVVRETDGARYQIGAKFFEDDRGITHLTLQRFNAKEPSKEIYFTFRGPEIT